MSRITSTRLKIQISEALKNVDRAREATPTIRQAVALEEIVNLLAVLAYVYVRQAEDNGTVGSKEEAGE